MRRVAPAAPDGGSRARGGRQAERQILGGAGGEIGEGLRLERIAVARERAIDGFDRRAELDTEHVH